VPKDKHRKRAAKQLEAEMPAMLQHLREVEAETGKVPTLIDALVNLAAQEASLVGPGAMLLAPHTLFVMGFSTGLRMRWHDIEAADAYLKAIEEFADIGPDTYGRPDLVCEMLVAAKKALDLYAERKAAVAAAE